MKPRILFLMHYMEIGGAEQALLGLLNALDYNRVEVDLFVYWHHGELMKYIPKQVHLLPENGKYSMLEQPIRDCVKNGKWSVAFARLLAKLLGKVAKCESFSSDVFTSNFTQNILPQINSEVKYDLAVSFLTPHTFVLKKVNAKKKVGWIHTDYTIFPINTKCELPVWGGLDNVISISPNVTETFLKVFPSLKDKIVEIENMMSPAMVRQRAEAISAKNIEKELISYMGGDGCKALIVISIGRYSHQKNFDNVPFICKELIDMLTKLISVGRFAEAKNYDNVPGTCNSILRQGVDVKWYLIGFGSDEELIRKKIKEAEMEEHVIILGKKENPYPYIKACDIYVQPSRYEGKSVTVREAQMLYKPVVVTNYPTASSQIKDGDDGVIVPIDNESCAKGIVDLIMDEAKQKHIIEYLHTHDYGNEAEVEKFYRLIH